MQCRRRKIGCDQQKPCTNCVKDGKECSYVPLVLEPSEQQKFNEIKHGVGHLERHLEKKIAKRVAKISARKSGRQNITNADETDSGSEPEDEKDLEITLMAVTDAAYDDDADNEWMDIGFRMGRLRVTDRIGNYFRPKMAEEVSL